MSVGEGATTNFETIRGRNYPTIRQFTVFLENRVGQLLEVVRRFEGSKVRIVALSINDATECSFVRFLLSHPEQGREILERAGLAMIESDLIGVELPSGAQPARSASEWICVGSRSTRWRFVLLMVRIFARRANFIMRLNRLAV